MRIRRLGTFLGVAGVAAAISLSASPAFAAGSDQGEGATVDEFVCFRSAGENIMLGTGRTITTPSGQTHLVCTGQPLSSG